MGVEALIEKINAVACREADEIIAEGKSKAEQIRKAIVSAADKKANDIISAATANAELTVRAAAGEDEINARIGILNHKRELMADALKAAKEFFAKLDGDEKLKLYTKYVSECGFVSGEIKVAAGQAEKALVSDKQAAKAAFDFDGNVLEYWTQKFGASFVLGDEAADDGELVLCSQLYDVNLSLDEIFGSVYADNEAKIAESLFGKEAAL